MPHLSPVLTAFAALHLSVTASAQDAARTRATLDADTRIRMTVASSIHPFTGVVLARRGDTLVVRTDADGGTMIVPLSQVVRLDVSHGARTTTRRGAVVGLGLGALAGLVVGAASYRAPDCTDSLFCLDLGPGPEMLGGAAVGGLAGLLVGAVIGSRSIELWESADGLLDGRTRLGIAPAPRGGVALRASFGF